MDGYNRFYSMLKSQNIPYFLFDSSQNTERSFKSSAERSLLIYTQISFLLFRIQNLFDFPYMPISSTKLESKKNVWFTYPKFEEDFASDDPIKEATYNKFTIRRVPDSGILCC